MAANITANTKAAILTNATLIRDWLTNAIATNGYQDDADAIIGAAGNQALPTQGIADIASGLTALRQDLANIKQRGRQIMDPILAKAAREAGSIYAQGQGSSNWPQMFRDINADLLGGTPDYVTKRAVTFASEPAAAAVGIYKRLTVDPNGEKIEDGYHNQTKTIRVTSIPAEYQSIASIQGAADTVGDDLDYRGGRPRVVQLPALNDANAPSGSVINPYLTPADLTDDADIATINGWTITKTGSPVFKVEAGSEVWRSRSRVLRFTGDDTTAVELAQTIPANVFSNPYRPYLVGVPIRLATGWQGEIDITWGSKTQQFTHSDLSNGAYVTLTPDRDKDIYPINFHAPSAQWKLKVTNTQNNTASIWVGGFLPYPMVQHEGVHYAHFSHDTNPTLNATASFADTSTFVGIIADVLSFLYHDVAPGWAHFPSSGTATMPAP